MKLTPKEKFEKRIKKALVADPYLDKAILVRKNGYVLKYKVEKIKLDDARVLYNGPVLSVEGDCNFKVGDQYSLSSFEIKYYTVLSK